MATLNLIAHPDHPPSSPAFDVWVNVDHAAAFGAFATTNLFFCVGAPAERFAIAEALVVSERRDELWKTTCFEAFLKLEASSAYTEWNFASSGEWATYGFSAHRTGMAQTDIPAPPYIRVEDNLTWWALGATIAVPVQRYALGLAAVLEERDGTKSYWALAHPPGAPDFHHDDCFAAHLG